MYYCYNCGSSEVSDIYEENNIIIDRQCNNCGSDKVFNDDDRELEDKLKELMVNA